jgi:restriction endonuclease S subunit
VIPKSAGHYFIFPSEMEGSRADFVFHHPEFDPIREFRRSGSVPLGSLITPPEHGVSLTGLEEGPVGFLNTQHITTNGEIIFEPRTFVEGCPEEALLREGDILIARTGFTLGKAAYITEEYAGFAFGSFCLRFSLLPDAGYRPEFIVRFLNSRVGQAQILMLRSGSDKPNINSDQIRDIRIPAAELSLQDEANKAARKVEREAIKLKSRAKGVRSLAEDAVLRELGIEIPPASSLSYSFKLGAKNKTLWFTQFPEGVTDRLHYLFFYSPYHVLDILRSKYTTVPLSEICQMPVIQGDRPEYEEAGEVMALKTVDLRNGYINYDRTLRVSREFFDAYPAAHVQKGDILIASTGSGSMGKVDIYERDEPAMISGELLALRVKKDYDPYFVTYFLRSPLGQAQFDKWFSGSSGQIHIWATDIVNFFVPDSGPDGVPLKEQRRIVRVIGKHLRDASELELGVEMKWQEAKKAFEEAVLPNFWTKTDKEKRKSSVSKSVRRGSQAPLFE